jgi:riboflavin synthase
MFTGIVTAVGQVTRVERDGAASASQAIVLEIRAPYRSLRRGESIAVAGACLTIEAVGRGGRFVVRTVATTQDRTLFAEYGVGRRVNLERAVRASDRLGGHLVQGHVDGIATVERVASRGDAVVVGLRVPETVRVVSIPQGSITVEGVSLTVNALTAPGLVEVSLIPYTRDHTTLGRLAVGDRVHVEADVIGKYVRQLCRPGQ